uniref:Uncharacterized protein n=1 Tax=Oryza punctata TaxID=4537 RepID=A0A0E0KY00_ORYPU
MDARARTYGSSGASPGNLGDRCKNYANYSSYLNDEPMPDAASEKEQGNEYFKQKKFAQAIECYSRSIGLSPSAVAFANRAMAYLKLRRQNCGRSGIKYSLLKLHQQIRLKPSGNCEPNIFREEDGRIKRSRQINDADAETAR